MLDVHADVLSLTVPGSLLSFPPSPSLLPASPPPGSAGHSAVELVEQEMVRGVALCCVHEPTHTPPARPCGRTPSHRKAFLFLAGDARRFARRVNREIRGVSVITPRGAHFVGGT